MPDDVHANIHEFFPHPLTGELTKDAEGDPLLGFYFQIVNAQGMAISILMGPYNSGPQAEEACTKAWDEGDY